jgi:two-component system, response regulator / RNA-binding antiterminator
MRIAVVDDSAPRAAIMVDGLAAVGEHDVHVIATRAALVRTIADLSPDVVLINLGNPSRDELEEFFAISRALDRPIAMFVDDSDEDAITASVDAGVSAYIVDGLASHRIKPIVDLAVRRFTAFSRLQNELDDARGELAQRKAVDQAKRILMREHDIVETAAYAMLRNQAMSSNRRIAEVAEALVTAQALLGRQGRGDS